MNPTPVSICGGLLVAAPEAAIAAIELVEILTGLGRPSAVPSARRTSITSGIVGAVRDPRVEAVAAKIGEPAAAIDVGLDRVRGFWRVIFRVGLPVTTAG